MPIRQKLKKVFSPSRISKKLSRGKIALISSNGECIFHTTKIKPYKPKYDKNGKLIPELYKPGETPRPKYREPIDKDHVNTLARFSFGLAEKNRRLSIASGVSPMDTREYEESSHPLALEKLAPSMIHRSSSLPELSHMRTYSHDKSPRTSGLFDDNYCPRALSSPDTCAFRDSLFSSQMSDDDPWSSKNPFGSFQWTQASSVDESGCDSSQLDQQRLSQASSSFHVQIKTHAEMESANLAYAMNRLQLQA